MDFFDTVARYNIYKWLREGDKAAEKRAEEKRKEKALKKRLVDTYGIDYYRNDKLWRKIKDQKKRETFDLWENRLRLFGFKIDGTEIKTGQRHTAKPLVHEYRFYSYQPEVRSVIHTEKNETEKDEMESDTWDIIYSSFEKEPRNVSTIARKKEFYVYAKDGDVWVESGKNASNPSKITVPRNLGADREKVDELFKNYRKSVAVIKCQHITYNASYWFAIFKEMDL